MESTRPIRALMRGFDALTVLNLRDGATVSEVAQEIKLPRTTVYRILETLCDCGFVFRDSADDRYRLTIHVRQLSAGFADEAWVAQIAKPHIDELSRDLVWPISLSTLSGDMMMVREATDHTTPLAVDRYSAGCRLPLLSSAAGRTFLAFCPDSQRDTLLKSSADAPRAELQRTLAEIKAQGYATTARTRRLAEEVSASVPVPLADDALAVLTLRFVSSTVPLKIALERFLPKLRHCATKISHSFSAAAA